MLLRQESQMTDPYSIMLTNHLQAALKQLSDIFKLKVGVCVLPLPVV